MSDSKAQKSVRLDSVLQDLSAGSAFALAPHCAAVTASSCLVRHEASRGLLGAEAPPEPCAGDASRLSTSFCMCVCLCAYKDAVLPCFQGEKSRKKKGDGNCNKNSSISNICEIGR